jgi:hypothetical protein
MAAMAAAAAATGFPQPEGFVTVEHASSATWAGLQQRQHSLEGSKAGDPGPGSESNLGNFTGLRSLSRAGSSSDGKEDRVSEAGTQGAGASLRHSSGSAGPDAVTPRDAGLPLAAAAEGGNSVGAGGSSTGRHSAGRPPPHPPHSGSSAAGGAVWRTPGLPFMAAAPPSPYQAYRCCSNQNVHSSSSLHRAHTCTYMPWNV